MYCTVTVYFGENWLCCIMGLSPITQLGQFSPRYSWQYRHPIGPGTLQLCHQCLSSGDITVCYWNLISLQIHHTSILTFQIHGDVLANNKENIKTLHYWPQGLWGGIQHWPMDSPHKRPVIQKAFLWHDVIMYMNILSCCHDMGWLYVPVSKANFGLGTWSTSC